jgi:antitoxin HicB
MLRTRYSFPAELQRQPDGSFLVRFPDLPEAVTDGTTQTEALAEAADCLSEALAGRIRRGEPIPAASPVAGDMHSVEPDASITLKTALYSVLRDRRMTAADLARDLGIDERKAARLIDPRATSSLTSLEDALGVVGYEIGIEVREKSVA